MNTREQLKAEWTAARKYHADLHQYHEPNDPAVLNAKHECLAAYERYLLYCRRQQLNREKSMFDNPTGKA